MTPCPVLQFKSLAEALVTLFGKSVAIQRTDRVMGGDINKSYALSLNTGDTVFMKANAKEKAQSFTAEAAGIFAIAQTGTIRTPKILCAGTDDGQEVGYSFLLMEFINSGERRGDYWQTLGRELAAMHQADASAFCQRDGAAGTSTISSLSNAEGMSTVPAAFGFYQDNYIGARPQSNQPAATWIEFFRDRRLAPQFKAADSYLTSADRTRATKLLDHLQDFLIEPKKPSLLHGDLWSGNVMAGPDGKAMLIDPVAYVGHAEADLAMTELFGGFAPDFYQAYKEANPLEPGYEKRRDLYNLYQLLNHLNLFGRSYLGSVLSVVDEYVG
ncbi:MAG: fructosamine kinase family protein [Treponema sp.]|nr:fructosamine kinase family protein [Treponema sp.]